MLYFLYDLEGHQLSEIWADNLNEAVSIANNNLAYLDGYLIRKENLNSRIYCK